MPGTKVMAQKPQIQKIAGRAWVPHWQLAWIVITRRENAIESYSNPRKTREELKFSLEKKNVWD